MALVRARGLVKSFGTGRAIRRVLDGADLDVEAGEVVAIVGRSGSGKSTLLHLLGGLDQADSGSVEVAGQAVTGASERALSALRPRRDATPASAARSRLTRRPGGHRPAAARDRRCRRRRRRA